MAKSPGKRRRLYPMPVECLIDHPLAVTLPAAGYGMLVRIALHFWTSECRPLPIADHDLRSIARGHAPTWRHWKDQIAAVLDEVLPEMEAYFRWRENNRETLRIAGQTGNGLQAMKALRVAARDRGVSPGTIVIPRKLAANAPAPVVPQATASTERKRRTG